MKWDTSALWRFAAVGLVAFGLRLGYMAVDSKGPGELIGDAREYHSIAVNLSSSGRYADENGDRLWRMPGYPVFLAFIYLIFRPSVAAAQIVQCLFGALACMSLYAAGRRLYGERWGLACGGAAAAYFGLIEPCLRILSETLGASLLCIFFGVWICTDKAWARVLGGATVMAAACIVRPDFLPFGGLLCLLLAKFDKRLNWRHSLAWFCIFGAFWAPWVIRNYIVFDKIIINSTQGAASFHNGLAFPLERLGYVDMILYIPHTLDELKQNTLYWNELGRHLENTPALRIAQAYLFNLASMYYPFLPEYDWTYMLLLPFWLASLLLLRKNNEARFFWLAVSTFTFIHTFVGGPVSRYRVPIAGAFILLAAAGAQELRRRYGPKVWSWSLAYTGANLIIWVFAGELRAFVLQLKTLVF